MKQLNTVLCSTKYYNNHKPFSVRNKAVPTLAALQMQRWALMLQDYTYEIEYRQSEDHANADALSRLLPSKESATDEAEIFQLSNVHDLPVDTSDIAEKTHIVTPLLAQVPEYVLPGWPNHVDKQLHAYFTKRHELSTERGCLLWGSRVYHQAMLAELHIEHSVISQPKSFARSYLWWPGMDAAIENMVQKCPVCQSVKNQPLVVPLPPWPWPTRIWQRIHIDFAEKSGKHYHIVVNSHFKWLEVVSMGSTPAKKTIDVLRGVFTYHGLPGKVELNNGPQFIAQEF